MTITYSLVFLLLLFVAELVYIQIAKRFGIVDIPNERTMHSGAVIRGGGVIFSVAVLLYVIFYGIHNWPFLVGLLLLAVVSFFDDLHGMPRRLRSASQLIAVSLIVYEVGYFNTPFLAVLLIVLFVGVLNAFNFMDGINGITGGYAAAASATFLYVNKYLIQFTDSTLLILVFFATIVFCLFNFRKKAICFAGDIGSIGIGFILSYFMLLLLYKTSNPTWILLFALYGVDTVLTIVHRIKLKENIFEPHRLHLFQVGVYNGGLSHLQMSSLFVVLQLIVNFILITLINSELQQSMQMIYGICILLVLGGAQIFLKVKLLQRA